jgi:predicted DsbA family dithiol-disulfide isomerase
VGSDWTPRRWRALYDQGYIGRTLAALFMAKQAGVTRVPTFVLGRTTIVGWHYYEVFQTVMEQQGIEPKTAGVLANQGH